MSHPCCESRLDIAQLESVADRAARAVPPAWPLASSVAVNPFKLARGERALRLPRAAHEAALARRGRDWAETRPEWALAGCQAFIAAPRSRTTGENQVQAPVPAPASIARKWSASARHVCLRDSLQPARVLYGIAMRGLPASWSWWRIRNAQ
mgnify:CR=1 FL=1